MDSRGVKSEQIDQGNKYRWYEFIELIFLFTYAAALTIDNFMGAAGAKSIAEALKVNTSITWIDIGCMKFLLPMRTSRNLMTNRQCDRSKRSEMD